MNYLHIFNRKMIHHFEGIFTINKYADLIDKGSTHDFLKFEHGLKAELTVENDNSIMPEIADLTSLVDYIKKRIDQGDGVIFHGSHYQNLWFHLLKLNKYYLKKIGYICWGEGLDYPKNFSKCIYAKLRGKYLFSNLAFIIVLSLNDRKLFIKKYSSEKNVYFCPYIGIGEYLEEAFEFSKKDRLKARIFLGHRNNENLKHLELLNRISNYPIEQIDEVYCPLNYGSGSKQYAMNVIKNGKNLLGEHFTWDLSFLPKSEYFKKICTYNIAIIPNHKKTQNALFVVYSMVASGTKIFMYPDDPNRELLDSFGIITYDIDNIGSQPFEEFIKYDNDILYNNFRKLKDNIGTEIIVSKYKNIFQKLYSYQ